MEKVSTKSTESTDEKPFEILLVEEVSRKAFYLFIKRNKDKLVPQNPNMACGLAIRARLGKLGLNAGGFMQAKKVTRDVKALAKSLSLRMVQAFCNSDVYKHMKSDKRIKMLEDVCYGWVSAPNDVFERLKIYEELSASSRARVIKRRFVKASDMQKEQLQNAEAPIEKVVEQKTHKLRRLAEADNIRVANSNIVPTPAVFMEDLPEVMKEGLILVKTYRETKEEHLVEQASKISVDGDIQDMFKVKEDARLVWCSKRLKQLATEYSLETADQIQLQTLVALEWSIRQMNASMKDHKLVNPKRISDLIITHNSLMKALNITRKARQDRGDEAVGVLSWDKLIRFHAEHKKIRYEQCSQQLLVDWVKLRKYDEDAKADLEAMGFFGDYTPKAGAPASVMNTVLDSTETAKETGARR